MTRLIIKLRAFTFFHLTRLGFFIFNIYNRCPSPTSSEWIGSTLDTAPGKKKIKLDIWEPSRNSSSGLRPCIITLHAGGFVMGQATDDSLWIKYVQDHLDAVVIGVNYRLAPRHPFPTAVEDVVDAFLWISKHAVELGIDKTNIIITGFSAGGDLSFSSLYLLHQLADDPRTKSFDLNIRGIITFYPSLDYSLTRQQKLDTCSRPDLCLPKHITQMCDESYFAHLEDKKDPRLSPALAPDNFLMTLPSLHFCLAEYDMLAQEALDFRDRLETLRPDMDISCRVTKGVPHAFDKPPKMRPRPEVAVEYKAALEAIVRWLS